MLRHLATYLLASVDNLLEVVLGGESLDSGDSLPPVPLFDPDVDQPVLHLVVVVLLLLLRRRRRRRGRPAARAGSLARR